MMHDNSPVTVAISRQRGSGGAYIGRCVARRLGLRYIDRDLLRQAAEFLHQRTERSTGAAEPSWWERLGSACALGHADAMYMPPSAASVYEGDIFEAESRLIQEIIREQAAVIVGRGAAQTLRGRPAVITVFVHAPEPWRADRLQRVYGIGDHADALRAIRESDRERARFVRRLVELEWTDARHYDVALDPAAMGFDAAVDLVERAAAGRLAHTGTIPEAI
jgi:cytidylate kinase